MKRNPFIHMHKKSDSIEDLNLKILSITTGIKKFYPELAVFLDEMPINYIKPWDKSVSVPLLKSHLDSLKSLLSSYLIEKMLMDK